MSEKRKEQYKFQYGFAIFKANGDHIKDMPVSEEIMELFLPTQTPDHSPIADEFIFDMTKTQCEKTPGYENLYEVSNKDAFRSSKNYYCTQCKKLVGGAHMHATNGTNNKTLPTQPDDHE